jgi:hypothetical protein
MTSPRRRNVNGQIDSEAARTSVTANIAWTSIDCQFSAPRHDASDKQWRNRLVILTIRLQNAPFN